MQTLRLQSRAEAGPARRVKEWHDGHGDADAEEREDERADGGHVVRHVELEQQRGEEEEEEPNCVR